MSASVCTVDEVVMNCLLAEIEWDMMVLVHDMQKQVHVAQILRREKRITDLEARVLGAPKVHCRGRHILVWTGTQTVGGTLQRFAPCLNSVNFL
jgi:hypothetical protein